MIWSFPKSTVKSLSCLKNWIGWIRSGIFSLPIDILGALIRIPFKRCLPKSICRARIREYAAAKPLVFHKLKTYLTPTTLADEEISDTEKPLIAPEETEKRAHLLFEEAQAFQEAKKREKALDCYQRRAALEGDRKEVFWSLCQIG